jgi:drug/metabolite transporter (DMT)-like permease
VDSSHSEPKGNSSRPKPKLHHYVIVPIAAATLSFYWIATVAVSRVGLATHLPLAFIYLAGAVILFLIVSITERRLPDFSIRLFQAAVTIGGLVYFMGPFFCLVSLRTLPSALGALAFALTPLFFLFIDAKTFDRLLNLMVGIVALCIYYYGSHTESDLRGNSFIAFVTLFGYPLCLAAGAYLARKLFWTHAPGDLNLWSMLVAGIAHLSLAFASGEWSLQYEWGAVTWYYIAYLAIVPTGLGYFIYQIGATKAGTFGAMTYSLVTPTVAILTGYALWAESPINEWVGIGLGLMFAVIALDSYAIKPARWMCHYLRNDVRQGDRLMCHLDAEAKINEVSSKIQVVDLSLGGLGFRSETGFAKGETVGVDLPISNQGGNLRLDCTVAHIQPYRSAEFPWSGGLVFPKLSAEKSQYLVEFLAKLAKAGDR